MALKTGGIIEAEKTRIESQARTNDRFFAGMVNEIQHPIGSVVDMAEILLASPLDQKLLDIAHDIKETMQTALMTVNDVLDLSKINSGNLALEEKNYDFISTLKTIRSTAFFQAKEKGLRFEFKIDPALPRCLFGDPGRLRQILVNIIGNAIKYTDSGQISVSAVSDGDYVRFNIADTGIGMDSAVLDVLFTPFLHPHGDDKNKKKGTGLGLAISKSLVEMMGGSLIVDSVPGAGSRFHLHIPVRPGDPDAVSCQDQEDRSSPDKGDTAIMPDSILYSVPGYGTVEMAATIKGLDTDAGLAMVAGQYGMYEELLHLASETLPELVESLLEAGRHRNAARLLIEINGLEESLHTLGMTTLSVQARECENELESGGLELCETKIHSFLANLRQFVVQLQALFISNTPSGPSSSSVLYGDTTALEARLHKILHEMGLGNHVQVRKLTMQVSKRDYVAASRATLLEIRRLVNAGEYRMARDRITAVLAKLRK